MSGFLGAGYVKINRFDSDGNLTGAVNIGNTPKFSIQASSETKERLSYNHNSYQQPLDSVVIPKPHELTMSCDEMSSMVMAIALLGEDQALSVTGAEVSSASPESITAILGKGVALAHRHVTSVVVKDSTDTTTYVSGTDYTLDATLGQITALSTGDIEDEEVLHVSYTYASQSGTKVLGGTTSQIKVQIELMGKNLVTGRNVYVKVRQCTISPSGAIDMIGDDYISSDLTGKLIVPDGENEAYYIEEYTTS